MAKKRTERKEAWFRVLVLIVSGILLGLWKILVAFLAVINWFVVMFSNKRNKGIAEFCEYHNTEAYKFMRYLTFVNNVRPFPFTDLQRMSRFERHI
jgi:hypothetical protein